MSDIRLIQSGEEIIMVFKPYELEPAFMDEALVKSEITESIEKKLEMGKKLREKVSREDHGDWTPPTNRRDPIDIIIESNEGRLEDLVPIRHGRMMVSPFTFLRGSAAVMAYDLSETPTTGLTVQACGDCHLSNFGLFATPERNLIFDVNDFDETIPGPWEWDLKRLVASIYVGYTQSGRSAKEAYNLSATCANAYRKTMRRAAGMKALDIWYFQYDIDTLMKAAKNADVKKRLRVADEAARKRVHEYIFPKITEAVGRKSKIVDDPPLVMHSPDPQFNESMAEVLNDYRVSMPHNTQVILNRYKLTDIARKVVGVGSVGTRCVFMLLEARENDPLLLQIKEARDSVFEPYVKKSKFRSNGQRVVVGQKIMQSASDMFLGWTKYKGRDFYVRQLKDMKFSAVIEQQPMEMSRAYVIACALVLAKAHARSGDPALIAGYLGKGDVFDYTMADFAKSYAVQNAKDHQMMLEAIETGRLEAKPGL
jgi:uncharacterized protein (DUF2252 family)